MSWCHGVFEDTCYVSKRPRPSTGDVVAERQTGNFPRLAPTLQNANRSVEEMTSEQEDWSREQIRTIKGASYTKTRDITEKILGAQAGDLFGNDGEKRSHLDYRHGPRTSLKRGKRHAQWQLAITTPSFT